MAFVVGLGVFLLAWNNLANLAPAFETAYVPVNLVVTAVIVLVARWLGYQWDQLGLDRVSMGPGLRWGAAAFAVVAVGLGVALALPLTRPLLLDERVAGLGIGGLAWLALVRIPLGTVVLEEVAFRGVLLGTWAARRSVREALLGQGLVFGLWHVTPTWIALETNGVVVGSIGGAAAIAGGVVVTAVAGVLFGWLRLRSGSVLAPALAHVATNSVAAAASVAAARLG